MTSPLIPTIRYQDCPRAIQWLCDAFGFESGLVVPSETGAILHAQLVCRGAMLMLATANNGDEFGRLNAVPKELAGQNTASIYMVVEDADAHCQMAINAGARIVLEVEDQAYGGRGYTCSDIEGHLWSFGTYNPWAGMS